MGLNDTFPRKGTTQTMKITLQHGVALNSANHPGSDGPEEWELVYAVADAAEAWAEAREDLENAIDGPGDADEALAKISKTSRTLYDAVSTLRVARERAS